MGPWMNLGADVFIQHVTPRRYRPGLGLRPGEPSHPVAHLVPVLYAAMYESIAAHSRAGLNVVVDVGHHDAKILSECARRLAGLPVLFVGVRCPIEVIRERRIQTGWASPALEDPIPPPVLRWQSEVHRHGIYDVEVDTSLLSPEQCAETIRTRLRGGPPPSAFRQLAEGA